MTSNLSQLKYQLESRQPWHVRVVVRDVRFGVLRSAVFLATCQYVLVRRCCFLYLNHLTAHTPCEHEVAPRNPLILAKSASKLTIYGSRSSAVTHLERPYIAAETDRMLVGTRKYITGSALY